MKINTCCLCDISSSEYEEREGRKSSRDDPKRRRVWKVPRWRPWPDDPVINISINRYYNVIRLKNVSSLIGAKIMLVCANRIDTRSTAPRIR